MIKKAEMKNNPKKPDSKIFRLTRFFHGTAGLICLSFLISLTSCDDREEKSLHFRKKEEVSMMNKTNPPGFRPYDGQMTVRVNYDVNLSGMDLKDIIDFRIKKVNEYSSLNIFHRDYLPIKKIIYSF